jgi:enoyl-CoA hydratase/carnithine racemase
VDDIEEPYVLRRDDGAVATLTLNRARSRNALSLAMLRALSAALDEVDADRSVHVVVLAGAGPAFCAGHDLRELWAATAPTDAAAIFDTCSSVMLRIGSLRQPVIASVGGIATAAGCQLVASCDLAVAARSARFATPGVDIGLFCSTPMVAVTRTVAPKHAMQLLLTGEAVDADTALRFGLVNEVVEDDDLATATAALAATIAAKPAAVVAAGKATYRRQAAMSIADAYEVAGRAMVDGLAEPDAAEGIGAFLEKRPPTWR